jgi:hypothetical protein
LQKSLDKEDRKLRKERQKEQKKSRQQQRKQKRQQKRNSTENEQDSTPTQPPKPKRSRPTAMPTANQIRTQNPWKVNGQPTMKPFVKPHSRAPHSTPANTTAGSPTERSFNRDVTVTSTPKHRPERSPSKEKYPSTKNKVKPQSPQRTRKQNRDEQMAWYTEFQPRSVRTNISPSSRDSTPERRNTPAASRSRSPQAQRTRQRSPSPPRPGSGTKFQRKKAPNGDNLYHYKLWSPLNTTYPRFAHSILSADNVKNYLTGYYNHEDMTTPTNTIIIGAHGFDTNRKITLKPNLVTNEIEITEVTKYIHEEFGEFHINGFNFTIADLTAMNILITNACTEALQPLSTDKLQYDQRIYRQKILTANATFKLTILYRPTTKGPERMVHIAMKKIENRKKSDSGYITIPWLLLIKLVQAIHNMKTYLQGVNTNTN